MAVYNPALDMLESSVDSVLMQTYRNLELVIVDDSTDQSVKDYLTRTASNDSRVRYIHNRSREGYVKSLNMALSLAEGSFIAKMDADDVSEVERIKVMAEYMENNPSVGVVGSALRKISPLDEDLGVRYYPEDHESIRKQMCMWNAVAHSTIMVRRDVFDRVGSYDEKVEVEDYELWLRCLAHGVRFANIPKPLTRYRIYSEYSNRGRHWKANAAIKLRYFNMDHLFFRLIGLLSVGIACAVPAWLEKPLYRRFNQLR